MRDRGRQLARSLAVLALACTTGLAAACGGGGEATTPTTVVITAEPVTETVVVTEPAPSTGARPPTPGEASAIASAVAEVVAQCQAVAAGYVDGPERDTLEQGVQVLADAVAELDADAPFVIGAGTDLAGETTLRDQVRLAARQLRNGCAPDLAERLGA